MANEIWQFNKGEWTEAYVFLRLLGDGRIYGANEDLCKDERIYIDIVNIIRYETDNILRFERILSGNEGSVACYENEAQFVVKVAPEFSQQAEYLYNAIKDVQSGNRRFSIPDSQGFLSSLHFSQPKSPGFPKEIEELYGKKTDIIIETEDSLDRARTKEGFSIKSHLGSNPTLFNSSTASRLVYEIKGCTDEKMHSINAIDEFSKRPTKNNPDVQSIVRAIKEDDSLQLKLVADKCDKIFKKNIMFIDSQMLKILDIVARLQCGLIDGAKSSDSADIVAALAVVNPLEVDDPNNFYTSKIKNFHFDSFSGMTAARPWDGRRKLSGGYIDVDKEGGMLYYRAISDDVFCSYLFKHLYFDRPDRGYKKDIAVARGKAFLENRELTEQELYDLTYEVKNGKEQKRAAKGEFGFIYKELDKFYIDLNFQTRFR